MKICDAHIHVGQFFDQYTSPQALIELTKTLGIAKYAVSSTTICEENYSKVLSELEYLYANDSDRAYPVLWITPALIANERALNAFLTSGLKWSSLKIHPDLHPYIWTDRDNYFNVIIDLASEYDLPILIHTGGNEYSEAKIWKDKIKANGDRTFILAHSRPFWHTIELMKECKNVYADLAFVGKQEMSSLLHSEIAKNLLWGSDIPIVDFYLQQPNIDYYNDMYGYLMNETSRDILELITKGNFKKIFEGK